MESKNIVALVTGGMSGIGLAVVRELLKADIKNVCILDIQVEIGYKVVEDLLSEFKDANILFVKTDVSKEWEMEDAFKQAIRHYKKIDLVINNAGIGDNDIKTVHVNLIGNIIGTQLGIKYMGKHNGAEGGIIMSTSSIHCFIPLCVSPIYDATKHGILGLIRSYGQDYHFHKTGIKFMCVCPDGTRTPIKDTFKKYIFEDSYWDDWERPKNIYVIQSSDTVGRAFIYVLKNAENGSIWVVTAGSLLKMEMPRFENISKMVVQNI